MIINLSYVLNKFFLGACLLITTNLYSQDWEKKEKTYPVFYRSETFKNSKRKNLGDRDG